MKKRVDDHAVIRTILTREAERTSRLAEELDAAQAALLSVNEEFTLRDIEKSMRLAEALTLLDAARSIVRIACSCVEDCAVSFPEGPMATGEKTPFPEIL